MKEADEFISTPRQRRILERSIVDFVNFEIVAINLQNSGLSDDHFILDQVCDDYPTMSNYLSIDANIVHDKNFDNAVVKIMNGHESQLNNVENNKVRCLKVNSERTDSDQEEGSLSYFERIQAKSRRLSSSHTKYINCRFIPATSRTVERLFSSARWIGTYLRKHMSPKLFEALLVLTLNLKHWDKKTFAAAMKLQPKDRYVLLDDDLFYGEDSS